MNSGGSINPIRSDNTYATTVPSGSGITSINSLVAPAQMLTVITTGTAPGVSSSIDAHTIVIPSHGSGSDGTISPSAQTIYGQKTFNSGIIAPSLTSSGALTITSATNTNLTIDAPSNGKLVISDLESQGIIFAVKSGTSSMPVIVSPEGDVHLKSLCLGVYNNGGNYIPFIGGQNQSSGWNSIHIQPDPAQKIFIGTAFTEPSSTANIYVANTIDFRGNIYVSNSLLCDTSRNLTVSSVNGIVPTGFVTTNSKMVCGHVDSAGNIVYSSGGFSMTKPALGMYYINFTTTYNVCVLSLQNITGHIYVTPFSANIATVTVVDSAGLLIDADFHFWASVQ